MWYAIEWIHTLQLLECQGTPSSKRLRYLKFKWLQWDLNPQSLSSETNTQPFRPLISALFISNQFIMFQNLYSSVSEIFMLIWRVPKWSEAKISVSFRGVFRVRKTGSIKKEFIFKNICLLRIHWRLSSILKTSKKSIK